MNAVSNFSFGFSLEPDVCGAFVAAYDLPGRPIPRTTSVLVLMRTTEELMER